MQYRSLAATALATALLGASAAQAQTSPAPVTDVAPLPAEERSSTGAVVLETSPVPAQRKAFAEADARTGVGSVGRGVLRATMRAQTEADLASARLEGDRRLRERGAGSLVQQ